MFVYRWFARASDIAVVLINDYRVFHICKVNTFEGNSPDMTSPNLPKEQRKRKTLHRQ